MVTICWFRRVLRLDDHPALVAAARAGAVIPVVILDPQEAARQPASALRQALSLPPLDAALQRLGSRLIVRRGAPMEVLADLVRTTGAREVHTTFGFPFASDEGWDRWGHANGVNLHMHPNGDLLERGALRTQTGGAYKVYTPFWKALRAHGVQPPQDAPKLSAPPTWPRCYGLDWPEARKAMNRGWDVVARHVDPGEEAAWERLESFLDEPLPDYNEHRNHPFRPQATSGLSDALAVGEISARRVWDLVQPAMMEGKAGADVFASDLAWREFARDLLWAYPALPTRCWRLEWERFPWERVATVLQRWSRRQTGVAMVDAGQRELFATGRMHNRVRMITASYLTKHLLTEQGPHFSAG